MIAFVELFSKSDIVGASISLLVSTLFTASDSWQTTTFSSLEQERKVIVAHIKRVVFTLIRFILLSFIKSD